MNIKMKINKLLKRKDYESNRQLCIFLG
jgi:hypothetical protein